MDPLFAIAIILVCLVTSAFFSGSETALLRLRDHEIEEDVREARAPAPVAVRSLLSSTSRFSPTAAGGEGERDAPSGINRFQLKSKQGPA